MTRDKFDPAGARHPEQDSERKRRLRKSPFLKTGLFSLALLMFAVRAWSAEIAGSVTDTQNHPVTPAHVSVKDSAGNIVGQVDADPNGHFSIGGIARGEYSISLTLPGTRYQGQTVRSGVPPEGLCLYWTVSQSAGALATGRPAASAGTCTPLSTPAAGAKRSLAPEQILGRVIDSSPFIAGGTVCGFSGESSGKGVSARSAVAVSGKAGPPIGGRPREVSFAPISDG